MTSIAQLDLTRLTYFRGRVAMAAILRGLGVKTGDEVLIQAFTCLAVPEAVLSVGAKVVYVDVEPGRPNMDPDDLARKLTAQTRAVVVQHSYGLPADISRLIQIANEAGVPVIEDCAHTIASRVDGRLVGSFGTAAFYSYEAAKPVFVGIGGSAVINDAGLAAAVVEAYSRYRVPAIKTQLELAALFLAHRVAYRPTTYWTVRAMFRGLVSAGIIRGNYNKVAETKGPAADFTQRMGKLQQRILRRALTDLEAQTAHRRWVVDQYRSRIRAPEVVHFSVADGVDPVFGRYPMLVEDKAIVLKKAREARVELADFYATAIHPFKGDELRAIGYEPGSCPNAEWIAERIISLPTGPVVGARQVQGAVEFFNSYSTPTG